MQHTQAPSFNAPPQVLLALSPNPLIRGYAANEVLPRIWLGKAALAISAQTLKVLGITHVLTVASDVPEVQSKFEERKEDYADFEYLCLDINDFGCDAGISRKFEEGFEFIDAAVRTGSILVHCANGSNRSPTFVLAYTMARTPCSLQSALELVLRNRPHIQPLRDNLRELQEHEQALLRAGKRFSPSTTQDIQKFLQKEKKKAMKAFKIAVSAASGANASAHTDKATANTDIAAAHANKATADTNVTVHTDNAVPNTDASVVTDAVLDCPQRDQYISFMEQALRESHLAVLAGNHPFGAVLVLDGQIVLRAQNAVVVEGDATRHAELVLVSKCSQQLTRTDLARAVLVTSTAPCPMCAGAIYWSGIGTVVYGCPAETLGEISGEELSVDCQQIFKSGRLHSVEVFGPVCGEQAAEQHRQFWPDFVARGNAVVEGRHGQQRLQHS